jgi:hypothetical protein
MGLAMRVVGVHGVQSHLGEEPAEPAEQGVGAPLQRGWSHPQDTEDGMIPILSFHKFCVSTCL